MDAQPARLDVVWDNHPEHLTEAADLTTASRCCSAFRTALCRPRWRCTHASMTVTVSTVKAALETRWLGIAKRQYDHRHDPTVPGSARHPGPTVDHSLTRR